jgi:hypothetical protein
LNVSLPCSFVSVIYITFVAVIVFVVFAAFIIFAAFVASAAFIILLLLLLLPFLLFCCFCCFYLFYYFAASIFHYFYYFCGFYIFCRLYYFLLSLIFFVISILFSIYATFHFALFIDYSILLAGNDFKIDSLFFFTHKTHQLGSLPTGIKDPAASNGVSNLQRCRAAGSLTLAAVAKCLQAATWLVARGNKPFWQKNGKP